MSKRASPTVIGVFMIAAAGLLLGALLLLGAGRLFHEKAHVIVYFDTSVAGLRVGAPVRFRGIDIGAVKAMRINMTGAVMDPEHVRIPVLLEIDEDRLREEGVTRFDFSDPELVNKLVAAGLRAQLASDSLVTGVLYVALDVRPDTPARLVHDRRYAEIPSLRTAREAIPEKVDQVLTNLAALDVDRLAKSLQSTIDNADKLVSSPGLTRAVARIDELTRHLDEAVLALRPTIAEVQTAAASADKAVGANGQLATQIIATLRELQLTARSIRRLSDQLSRDPGALLRGGRT